MTAVLLTFLAASVAITITPGPDTLVVLRNGAAAGRRGAAATAAGVLAACLVLLTAVVVGLAGVVRANPTAYAVLRYAGAAYLVYLGARSILAWWRERRTVRPARSADLDTLGRSRTSRLSRSTESVEIDRGGRSWAFARQGFLTCILNPKLIAFLVAFFPQFTLPGLAPLAGNAVLAGMFLLVATAWFVAILLAIGWIGPWLGRPRVRAGVGLVSGVILVAMGVATALQR